MWVMIRLRARRLMGRSIPRGRLSWRIFPRLNWVGSVLHFVFTPNLLLLLADYRFFPKELWSTIGYSKKDAEDKEEENPEGRPAKRQKKLGLAKKSTLDKLAKFDEDHEDEPNAEADEDENEGGNEEEGEEFEREPEDDDFDEDDDDANNDYNAEAYFDGGEEDFEEQGGDEYGEDGY